MNIEDLWDYTDPALSEARFREALATTDPATALELQTQIARSYSLRGMFAEAHQILDEVKTALPQAKLRLQLRYLLERGRCFNSAGAKEQARSLFKQAWQQGMDTSEVGLTVDAIHMLAISYAGNKEGIGWNQQGIALAKTTTDPKAQALLPAMLNNCAWDLHDMGHYQEALEVFQQALDAWKKQGQARAISNAQWALARCLRSLGQYQEALDTLVPLKNSAGAQGNGYVPEELAENYLALGQKQQAGQYFACAFAILKEDTWLSQHEPERLSRLQALADALAQG